MPVLPPLPALSGVEGSKVEGIDLGFEPRISRITRRNSPFWDLNHEFHELH